MIYRALRLKQEVPLEDREFLDPLPKGLRLLWPLIRFAVGKQTRDAAANLKKLLETEAA